MVAHPRDIHLVDLRRSLVSGDRITIGAAIEIRRDLWFAIPSSTGRLVARTEQKPHGGVTHVSSLLLSTAGVA
jgi:hypothetical protein